MADSWLEKELARQLAPVAAPESLWDRIDRDRTGRQQRMPRRRISPGWAFWPVAVAMTLMAVAGVLRTLSLSRGSGNLQEQELALFARPSGEFDYRSNSFEDTRAWVKTRANIDIDLPPGRLAAEEGAVRMVGVRLTRLHGLPIAAIDYRAGDQAATLFVSGKHAGPTGDSEAAGHLFSGTKSAAGTPLYSWNMRHQTYTIVVAGAKNSRAACLLCHRNAPG